jgi:hypothetical protein
MDIILLGITIVSLGVALVMSAAAWRLTRDEKARSAARVAALSLAAGSGDDNGAGVSQRSSLRQSDESQDAEVKPVARAPWSAPPSSPRPAAVASASARLDSAELRRDLAVAGSAREGGPVASLRTLASAAELPLNQPARVIEPVRTIEPSAPHASGFLGATEIERDGGGRQRSLALAAVVLFLVLSGGLVWMMSGPEGTSAVAVGPNSPLELVSLSHQRLNDKLAVSGLVRNPVAGKPIEKLSAVVFLFDRVGTFITSSRADVDFLKLGAGDESPFVVSLNAPATVARYRVSFRTDEGVVPHIDRRGEAPIETVGIQPSTVKSSVSRQQ